MTSRTLSIRTYYFVASLAVAAAIVAAGCGSKSKSKNNSAPASTAVPTTQTSAGGAYDKSKLESKLKTILNPSSSAPPPGGASAPPVSVDSVSCPDTQPAAGSTISCSVTGGSGLAGSVKVTFDDAQGKAFHYKGKLTNSKLTQKVNGNATIG